MAISAKAAKGMLARLSVLPWFPTQNPFAQTELETAIREEAKTDLEAHNGISALLADPSRASSAETNRCPTPGELREWIRVARRAAGEDGAAVIDPEPTRGYCQKLVPGHKNPNGRPAQCERGWISIRTWKRTGRLNADGEELMQPIDWSGRCSCVGGTL